MILSKDSVSFKYINIFDLIEKKIGIPIFQRKYAWNDKHAQKFLSELLEISNETDKELYLLDFIYYDEDDKYMIADGQQRLVTLNLLIKAINNHISEKGLEIRQLPTFSIEYDVKEYDVVYKDNFFNDKFKQPFKKLYLHLKKWVSTHENKLHDVINVLKNNIFIYIKECKSADDAFNIFLQINTGGKPLTKDEVITTTMNQYKEIYKIAYDARKNNFDIKQAITSYYKLTNQNVSKEFDNIELITFLKQQIVKTKETFQEFVEKIELLKDLERNPLTSIFTYLSRKTLIDILNILTFKKIDVFQKREYLKYVLFPLSLLSIVLSLSGGLPSIMKGIINLVIPMIKDGERPENISDKIAKYIDENSTSCKISFEDFVASLGPDGKGNANFNKAIFLLDNIWSNASTNINIDLVELEHVYPQKPHSDWASCGGWPSTSDEQKKFINNIGNQFLLNGKINNQIKNKYITEKIKEYEKINESDVALNTQMNKIDFKEFRENGMEYIVKRQRKIAEIIYNDFPLAKRIITKN